MFEPGQYSTGPRLKKGGPHPPSLFLINIHPLVPFLVQKLTYEFAPPPWPRLNTHFWRGHAFRLDRMHTFGLNTHFASTECTLLVWTRISPRQNARFWSGRAPLHPSYALPQVQNIVTLPRIRAFQQEQFNPH